jgi:hypothetical protein
MVLLAAENAMGRSANPGVDLTWGGDPFRLVDEAVAGGLDRVLDLLRRGFRMQGFELGAELAASLSPHEAAEKRLGATGDSCR